MSVIDFGLVRKLTFPQKNCFFRLYRTATAASLLYPLEEQQPFGSAPTVQNSEFHETKHKPKLIAVVPRVLRSLSWSIAREVRFKEAVCTYGFAHSIYTFSVIVDIFASAGMHCEVRGLLRDIVCYCKEVNHDTSELLPALWDSSSAVENLVVVSEVLIKTLASLKMAENAVTVFEQAKVSGIELGVLSCNYLLKCLVEHGKVEFVTALFDIMKHSGPQPNEYTYTILMKFYCRKDIGQGEQQLQQAAEILEEMMRCGVIPTVVTYGTFIHGLCRMGDVSSARNLLMGLRQSNQNLNSNCYNAVIHGLCRKGELCEAKRVMEEMRSCGVSPDVHSYSILIDGFCKKMRVSEGISLMQEMIASGLEPSIVTYSSFLSCLCKSGQKDVALEKFRSIGSSCCNKHDHISYNILIDGYCKHGDADAADKFMEEMIANGLVPDVHNYNTLLHGYCKVKSLKEVLPLFGRILVLILKRGMLPNTVTCTIIVDKYCKEGTVEEALSFMDEMQDRGIVPNLFTYNAIVSRLCKERKSKKAKEIIPLMLKRNLYPDVVIYSTLVDGFLKESNVKEALNWYNIMSKGGITPNAITYTNLITELCNCKRTNEAWKLFEEMTEKGLAPDKVSYTAIISGFCKIGDMRTAWQLFEKMEQRGVTPNVVTCTTIEAGFCRLGDQERAFTVYNIMKKRKYDEK